MQLDVWTLNISPNDSCNLQPFLTMCCNASSYEPNFHVTIHIYPFWNLAYLINSQKGLPKLCAYPYFIAWCYFCYYFTPMRTQAWVPCHGNWLTTWEKLIIWGEFRMGTVNSIFGTRFSKNSRYAVRRGVCWYVWDPDEFCSRYNGNWSRSVWNLAVLWRFGDVMGSEETNGNL